MNLKEQKLRKLICKTIKEEMQNHMWPMDEWKLEMKKHIESLQIGIENTDENLVISVCEKIIRMTKKLQDFED